MYNLINKKEFVAMWNECIALVKRSPNIIAAYLFAWSRANDEM